MLAHTSHHRRTTIPMCFANGLFLSKQFVGQVTYVFVYFFWLNSLEQSFPSDLHDFGVISGLSDSWFE